MKTTLHPLRAIAVAVAVVLPVSGSQVPQFRAAVDLVHLDVSVLDGRRRPVRGLTAADFTVLEDGKPQSVSTFAAVDFPDAVPPTAPWMRTVAPDTRRNDTLDDRRLFVIVMDDGTMQQNLPAIRSAKETARTFIDRLGPSDLAAVLFTLRNQHAQDYTSDKARLLAAVDKFAPGFRDMGKVEGGPDTDENYYRSSIEVLRQITEALIALPQRRKTLVYIGQGVPVDPEAASEIVLAAPSGAMAVGNAGMHELLLDRTRQVLASAQRSNVNIYVLDPCGVRMPIGETCVSGLEQEFLKDLAHATGGRAALDANDLGPAVEQVFVENASYYLLGFQSTNPRQEGKSRRLDVKVNRPDVEVRARSGYTERHAARDTRAAERDKATPLTKAVAGLLPKGDVPLQVWAAPFAISGQRDSRVVLTLGVRQTLGDRPAAITETVDVTVDAYTVEGRHRAGRSMDARVILRPGPAGDIAYEIISSITLQPGRYQLRIGAFLRSTRTSGSVYYDIDVPDFTKNALSLSGLALSAVPGITGAVTDAVSALPVRPTTARLFSRGDVVQAFVRLYQRARPAISSPVRARLLDADGREVWTGMDDVAATRFVNGVADLSMTVPTRALEPGPHMLALDALSSDRQTVIATREVRFTIR